MLPTRFQEATVRVRLSTRGRLVIPSALRRAQGWATGTQFAVEHQGGQLVLKPLLSEGLSHTLPVAGPTTMDEVFGSLRHRGRPLSVDEMTEGAKSAVNPSPPAKRRR